MTTSELKDKIKSDMTTAMRNRESKKVNAIRLIWAAIKQSEIDKRIELSDADVIAILEKLGKQRKDSIEQFTAAGRTELAEQEEFELNIIRGYLPKQLDESEVAAIIQAAIKDSGAESIRDMGKVMGIIKPKLQGRADMSQVSAKIKEWLS